MSAYVATDDELNDEVIQAGRLALYKPKQEHSATEPEIHAELVSAELVSRDCILGRVEA